MTQPNKPFIEAPEETAPQEGTLFCFLNAERPCTAECMAFLPVRPEGEDYTNQQWASCSVLVNGHKIGKHVVAIASQGANLLKHLRVKQQDDARSKVSG